VSALELVVNGRPVEVADAGESLLEVLRDRLGLKAAKDGCSPQGQCGCCTVWVDGAPRVACVTPARRVAGRQVTTLEGLDPAARHAWAEAFVSAGASQCGFCTPGIVMRLAHLGHPGALGRQEVERALLAHLCRCTGWRTIVEAATSLPRGDGERDLEAASRRATLEGASPQRVGPEVVLGGGGFADDLAPANSVVAVPDGRGGWARGRTLAEARAAAGKVQGRRSPGGLAWPLEVPPGPWELTLRTTWVEPAYLETDASWCQPGGSPASPLANGGAFGAKVASEAPAAARRLADEEGRPVRVVYSREDTVRLGPKRPPVAVGLRGDGTGVMRAVATPGLAELVGARLPGIELEEVEVAGPPTSLSLRGAGWAEVAAMRAVLDNRRAGGPERAPHRVEAPGGGWAEAWFEGQALHLRVGCGEVLDATVARSYCIGAAHMALGWVLSEGIALDAEGRPCDLTVRSFGVLRACDTPEVVVHLEAEAGPPVQASEAVLAAVAAATWAREGLAPRWPVRRAG
jgi:xanthine dehydrogenase small subunit